MVAKGLTDGQRTWIRKDLRPASKMVEALGQEGREEGKREQTLAFARHGLTLGESVEYVVGLSEQSLDTVQKLRAAQTGAWKTLLLGSLGMLAGTASRAVRCRSDMGGLGDC